METRDPPGFNETHEAEREDVTAGRADTVRQTGPANPPRLVTVIMEVPEDPALIVRVVGLANRPKSTTSTVTVAE